MGEIWAVGILIAVVLLLVVENIDVKIKILVGVIFGVVIQLTQLGEENHQVVHGGGKKISRDVYSVVKEFVSNKQLPKIQHYYDDAEEAKLKRVIDDDYPRKKYTRRNDEFKKILHWGQLKLFCNEVEFLMMCSKRHSDSGDKRPIVFVYAGAAPGDHTEYLSKMFADIQFELYDPLPFTCRQGDNINVHQQYFRDEDAKYWGDMSKDRYVIFASDIRERPAAEEIVKQNMDMQLGWWKIMKPEMTMFKFRLPWTVNGSTEYPKGVIYTQPYVGATSTETRLIVEKDAPLIKYEHSKYEEQLFAHNVEARNKRYDNELGRELSLSKDGVDNCYDCSSFVCIMREYKEFAGDTRDLKDIVRDVVKNITENEENLYDKTSKYYKKVIGFAKEKTKKH